MTKPSSRSLLSVWFSFLFILGAAVVLAPVALAKSEGVVVVSSRHKFAPSGAEAAKQPGIVHLKSSGTAKTRPDGTGGEFATDFGQRLTSKSAIVMDASSGEVLYAKAPDLVRQPASTIKVLTGLIALQSLKKKELVPTSRRAAGMPRSKIYLRAGKSYAADDLINAVLLASANDAAVALAEKIAGSERVFSSLMTHKAKELGGTRTVCRTASGLTAKGQKSTARDLAVMFNEAMKNHDFARRMAKVKMATGFGKVLRSHNRALWQVVGAEGGKTGYTRAARQTYVGKFKRNQQEILVALMGSETMWNDVSALVEHGFSQQRSARALQGSGQNRPLPLAEIKRLGALGSGQLLVLTDQKKTPSL